MIYLFSSSRKGLYFSLDRKVYKRSRTNKASPHKAIAWRADSFGPPRLCLQGLMCLVTNFNFLFLFLRLMTGFVGLIGFCLQAGRVFLFCLPLKKEMPKSAISSKLVKRHKKVTTCEKVGLILRAGHYPLASGQGLPVFRAIPMLQSGCKHTWTSRRTGQACPICFAFRYFIIYCMFFNIRNGGLIINVSL